MAEPVQDWRGGGAATGIHFAGWCNLQVHFRTDDETHLHFRTQLIALARRFAVTVKERSAVEQAALLLANSANFLAISRGDEVAAANALAAIAGDIFEAWPKAARPIWRLNALLLLRQPAGIAPDTVATADLPPAGDQRTLGTVSFGNSAAPWH